MSENNKATSAVQWSMQNLLLERKTADKSELITFIDVATTVKKKPVLKTIVIYQ